MYKSGVAAPVLPAESALTEAQKRAALAAGYGVSVINPEAEYLARVRDERNGMPSPNSPAPCR